MAKPMATSQDFVNWVCGDDLDPEYLMYALIRSRAELRALAMGATHKTIYMPTLEAFHICLPNLKQQKEIVSAVKAQLAAVAEARMAAEAQLREIERLPQRLLAMAFDFEEEVQDARQIHRPAAPRDLREHPAPG
jgi:type I restriction enzyme S subunit